MKPLHEYCSKYCDIYPCDRVECQRKAEWKTTGKIIMSEPNIYDKWRNGELKTVYHSVPLTKKEQ